MRLGIGSSGNAWRPAHATQWEANGKCLAVRDPCTNKQQNPPPAGPGGFACRPGYRTAGFKTARRWVGRQWAYVMKSLGQNRKSFGYRRPAKDEADLSSLRGAHEARQATALARPQAAPVLLFQCIDCGHVDMIEWPRSPPVKRRRETPDCLEPCLLLGCAKATAEGGCYILMADDDTIRKAGWPPEIASSRIGHCNGWPAGHRGARGPDNSAQATSSSVAHAFQASQRQALNSTSERFSFCR